MPLEPAAQARQLLRASRSAALATLAPDAQPFVSLVTPACLPDGSLVLLISRLAEHTKHLLVDPRCSILATGMPDSDNPQTTPRVTVTGIAAPADEPEIKARYLAIHPYASLYAGFTDFTTWRIVPMAASLVAGFAQAHRLASIAPDPAAVAAIANAEADIIAHCNNDHADALAAIARQPGAWRMVSVDVDGFDLAPSAGERSLRFAWSAPVQTAAEIRRELVRMTDEARG
jgi:heme iron utilization protein